MEPRREPGQRGANRCTPGSALPLPAPHLSWQHQREGCRGKELLFLSYIHSCLTATLISFRICLILFWPMASVTLLCLLKRH